MRNLGLAFAFFVATFAVFLSLPPAALGTGASSVQASARSYFSGIVTFASQIKLAAGTAGEPSAVFAADDDGSGTGIYRSAANTLGVSTNGTLRVDVDTTDITSTIPILVPAGAVGAPSVAFSDDADGTGTGFYRTAANSIGVAANGVNSLTITGSAVTNASGSYFAWSGRTHLSSPSNGVLQMEVAGGGGGFTRLNFGGSSNSFPAIARSTTVLSFPLADGTGASTLTGFQYNNADLPSTCTQGAVNWDTGGLTVELCFCFATNTYYCIAVDDTTGPAD